MAGALDASVGMLIAAALAYGFGLSFSPWLLLFGAFCALLPDFDILLPILQENVVGNHKLTLLHAPSFVLGLAVILGGMGSLYADSFFWLACPVLCLLWHYLHDTGDWFFGSGAVAWGWPYTTTLYASTGARILETIPHTVWIETEWLVSTPLSRKEIAAASICIGLAVSIPYGPLWGMLIASSSAFMAVAVWALYAHRA